MVQQLLDDLRGYFEAKSPLTKQEQELLNRLNEGYFPITSIHRNDLAAKGFDVRDITDGDMKRLAGRMASDYCNQLFWSSLEILAEDGMQFPRLPACPQCSSPNVEVNAERGTYHCAQCDRTWYEDLYVLVEFPDDATYFEENDIGYPSFGSEDNGARYVPEYDYIQQFKQDPPANAYFKPMQWPESQPHLFPDEPNESTDALCEAINDEKGRADFGEQAVWVPRCNHKS